MHFINTRYDLNWFVWVIARNESIFMAWGRSIYQTAIFEQLSCHSSPFVHSRLRWNGCNYSRRTINNVEFIIIFYPLDRIPSCCITLLQKSKMKNSAHWDCGQTHWSKPRNLAFWYKFKYYFIKIRAQYQSEQKIWQITFLTSRKQPFCQNVNRWYLYKRLKIYSFFWTSVN